MTGSVASEIVARVAVELHYRLVAAPIRLAHPDHPEPTSHGLTRDYHVTAADIAQAVLKSVGRADRVPKGLGSQTPHDVPGPWFAGPF
jgi:pyruvate dehydrogenase E1 component beta subunit